MSFKSILIVNTRHKLQNMVSIKGHRYIGFIYFNFELNVSYLEFANIFTKTFFPIAASYLKQLIA
jgi:hypothetical protein